MPIIRNLAKKIKKDVKDYTLKNNFADIKSGSEKPPENDRP